MSAVFTLHPETVWEGITTLYQIKDDADEAHQILDMALVERCTDVIRCEIRDRNLPLNPGGPDFPLRKKTRARLWHLLPALRMSAGRPRYEA